MQIGLPEKSNTSSLWILVVIGVGWGSQESKKEPKATFLVFFSSWPDSSKYRNDSEMILHFSWERKALYVVRHNPAKFGSHLRSYSRVAASKKMFNILLFMGRLAVKHHPNFSKRWPDTQFPLWVAFLNDIYFHVIRGDIIWKERNWKILI